MGRIVGSSPSDDDSHSNDFITVYVFKAHLFLFQGIMHNSVASYIFLVMSWLAESELFIRGTHNVHNVLFSYARIISAEIFYLFY